MNEAAITNRKVYGRGYFDGQRKALESMNNARMASMEKNLTGIARKALEATPTADYWAVEKICTEMRRLGHNVDFRVVSGALTSLEAQGLVREPVKGCYIRTSPKPKLVSAEVALAVDEPLPPVAVVSSVSSVSSVQTASVASDPMARMIGIVASVRALAGIATQIAADIEDVTLEIEGRIERVHSDSSKLRQLQELLKSIGQ